MRRELSERQRSFYAELTREFPREDLYQHSIRGKTLTYITARTLANRLDEMCGPDGWRVEYTATTRGYTCRLSLLVPDETESGWKWEFKEDGGGFAGMQEADNDEKSGYSDSFKRAGVAWGIARYLYNNGVPNFSADDEAPAEPATARPARQAPPDRAARPAAPAQERTQAPATSRQYDNFRLPRPGAAVFVWAKGLEKEFGVGVVKMMDDIAKEEGAPRQFKEWSQEDIDHICWQVVENIKTWKSYKGQFDRLENPTGSPY